MSILRTLTIALLLGAVSTPAWAQAGDTAPFVVERHGQGRPVILIPGLMSSGRVWDGAVQRYADRYELHVLTLAGFAGVPPIGAPHFLDAERDAIIRYIRERRLERPVLVGHSLGAFLAFAVASAAPELVGSIVAVDGVPFLTTLGDSTLTPERVRPQAEAARAMYASLTAEQLGIQGRAAALTMVGDSTHAAMVASWSRASDPKTTGQAIAEMMTTDLREAVAAIRTPVLLVAAAEFTRTPEQREALRASYVRQIARVPDGRVVLAERARHFVMLDDPAFLFGLMDDVLAGAAAHRTGSHP